MGGRRSSSPHHAPACPAPPPARSCSERPPRPRPPACSPPAALTPAARAGGLVWNLPAPGTEARYEGEITQTLTGRDNQTTEIARLRRVTVRSLEAETAEYRGEQVPARWLEFVAETGTPGERGLDPGPAGRVVYKILTPESAIAPDLTDERGVPRAFLPVLRGWRQVGDGEPAELGPAFRAYPAVCLLTEFEPDEILERTDDAADVPAGRFEGTRFRAKLVEESRTARVTHEANWLLSDAAPFGPAEWSATVVRETKDALADRDTFAESSRTVSKMELVEVADDARGELPLP